jgi:hypothetical protein
MKKLILLLIICVNTGINLFANDGGYYVSGNQIIPMVETDISVKKEVLTIKRSSKNSNQAEVTVYYEFFNPGDAKTMTVGFEANSPSGDAQIEPENGEQPYIHRFTVEMNEQYLPYKVAIVNDSLYYNNGEFKTLSQNQIKEDVEENGESASFRYVYHFDANFKKGLNTIKHTYTCDFSTYVMANYEFSYILTAATRWGNKQIDDFTLIINMGDDQLLNIPPNFFDIASDWNIVGVGKGIDIQNPYYFEADDYDIAKTLAQFYLQKGYLVYQKRNFRPEGELYFSSPRSFFEFNEFDYKKNKTVPRDIVNGDYVVSAQNDISKKILRNIPFAERGYVFTNTELQNYFNNQVWYLPNSEYKADLSKLTLEEQAWVKRWSE